MKRLLTSKLFTLATERSRRDGCTAALSLASMACLIFAFCIAAAIASPAQTFTTLASFDGTNGVFPYAGLVQGPNGNFYGTTGGGGSYGNGTVFEVTPAGQVTTLYSFCSQPSCSDGATPWGLMLATNGNFYGITSSGGTDQTGTIFEITPAGQLTTIYRFCSQPECDDGVYPEGTLVQARNGNFYGTTSRGGINGTGTVFEVTAKGELTTLHSFSYEGSDADGNYPSGLVQATNGNLYGTTYEGGDSPDCGIAQGCGTAFEMTPAGELTTIYTFCARVHCTDGGLPGGLIEVTNGSLYGTTSQGGANVDCSFYLCGTVFEMTPAGRLTTIYTFCAQPKCADGQSPFGLLQATDGNFYGTADTFDVSNYGTIFALTAKGELTTLYNFCTQNNCADGEKPHAGMLQGTDGVFYGTTTGGGTYGDGVVFSLSVGLGPFVETVPTSARVGAKVIILGNDLKDATMVAFNGTEATIASDSNTEITTTVPSGATTGSVEVMTATGKMLESNVVFQVIP